MSIDSPMFIMVTALFAQHWELVLPPQGSKAIPHFVLLSFLPEAGIPTNTVFVNLWMHNFQGTRNFELQTCLLFLLIHILYFYFSALNK